MTSSHIWGPSFGPHKRVLQALRMGGDYFYLGGNPGFWQVVIIFMKEKEKGEIGWVVIIFTKEEEKEIVGILVNSLFQLI